MKFSLLVNSKLFYNFVNSTSHSEINLIGYLTGL